MLALVTLLCFAGALVNAVPLPAPFTEHCIVGESTAYPPNPDTKVPWFTINLDLPADQRWTEVTKAYKAQITDLLYVIKNLTFPFFHGKLVGWVDNHMGGWDKRLPSPYKEELIGIARDGEIPLGEVVLYNVFYEIFTVCTSIVAEDPNGSIFHARNLDFGLFLGWNPKTHEWAVTEKLRNMIINLDFQRCGKTVYKTTNFAGFVGAFTAMKEKKFAISLNERFDLKGGYIGIVKWLLSERNDTNWSTFFVRDVMEKANSYDEAVKLLNTTELMSPMYFIVSGVKSGQGAIITRSLKESLGTVSLNPANSNGWYLLQTNYDPWKAPLFIDDRRTPGNECMQKLGRDKVNFQGIYDVLSSKTTLNKLTAYTALMHTEAGDMEAYIRTCPNPCWAF